MEVNVIDNVATMRGIYLREAHETNQMIQKVVKVRPNFLEADDSFDMNPLKVSFELKIALVATQPWVTCPDHLILMHGGMFSFFFLSLSFSLFFFFYSYNFILIQL